MIKFTIIPNVVNEDGEIYTAECIKKMYVHSLKYMNDKFYVYDKKLPDNDPLNWNVLKIVGEVVDVDLVNGNIIFHIKYNKEKREKTNLQPQCTGRKYLDDDNKKTFIDIKSILGLNLY